MDTFKYTALSHDGERVKGVVDAFNELDAVERIKQDNDIIISLQQVKEKNGILNAELDANRLNGKAFTLMCSQFAIILKAGVPLGRAAHLIADKTTDKKLKKMLKEVAEDVEGGRGLADSFSERGGKFLPPTFIETVRAGEESGNLTGAFQSVFAHYDKQTKMAGKVRGALIYPIFVIMVAIVVVIVLMVMVVPTFTDIFASMDMELPILTQILIAVSNWFASWWIVIVAVIAAIVIAYKLYGNTEQGRLKIGKAQLKMPVLGNIQTLNAASQFANTMTTMLHAGLPITRAVSITAKVISNYYISQEVGKVTGKIEQGNTLGESVSAIAELPDILKDMVMVGESTGEMESTLDTVAAFYDSELEMAVDAAIKKLEPTLLVIIAGIAGFIVIAMYTAMFSMYAGM